MKFEVGGIYKDGYGNDIEILKVVDDGDTEYPIIAWNLSNKEIATFTLEGKAFSSYNSREDITIASETYTSLPEIWKFINSEWNWLTQDQDGVFLWTDKPVWDEEGHAWSLESGDVIHIKSPIFNLPDNFISKRPTPLEIDWSVIDEDFQWAAADADGEVYVYTEKPYIGDDGAWRPSDVSDHEFISKCAPIDWMNSLTKRP